MLLKATGTGRNALVDLCAGIGELQAEDLDGFSDVTLGEDLIDLNRQTARAEYDMCRRLWLFIKLRGHEATGSRSAVSWLMYRLRVSRDRAGQFTVVGKLVDQLPLTDAAFRDGDITLAHAAVICRAAEDIGVERVREAEETLVDLARRVDPGKLSFAVRRLRECIDPEGAQKDDALLRERRALFLNQSLDGLWFLNGVMTPDAGALLRSVLNSLSAPVPGETRTAAQRRADALEEMARRLAESGTLPMKGGVKPHITLIVTEEALQGEPGAGGGEIIGAGPVTSATAQRYACDAAVTTFYVSPDGKILNYDRTKRTIPPALRRALMMRDGHCVFPGCDMPKEWTEGHHIIPWSLDGTTDLSNTCLVCTWHHTFLHERGWHLERSPDGEIQAIRDVEARARAA